MKSRSILLAVGILLIASGVASAQGGEPKHFTKDGLSFDYPPGWSVEDASNSDAQVLKLTRPDADLQLTVFAHRGRITAEKMADAHKAFIDPYVDGTAKQFTSMGARVDRTPDTSDIAGAPAEGVKIKVMVTGDSATSQIYWALVNQRVVILTYFGPDNDRKKFASSWDMVRNSLKIEDAKPKASPTPKH